MVMAIQRRGGKAAKQRGALHQAPSDTRDTSSVAPLSARHYTACGAHGQQLHGQYWHRHQVDLRDMTHRPQRDYAQ